jgi:chromosomal replication initiator protein
MTLQTTYMALPGINFTKVIRREMTRLFEIEKIVCDYFDIPIQEIRQPKRHARIIEPKHIIKYLAKKHTKLTFSEIAKPYNQDHSTTIHSVNTVRNLSETDKHYRQRLNEIEELVVGVLS